MTGILDERELRVCGGEGRVCVGDYMTTCVRAEGMDRNKSVDAAVDVGEVEKGAGFASAHRARGVSGRALLQPTSDSHRLPKGRVNLLFGGGGVPQIRLGEWSRPGGVWHKPAISRALPRPTFRFAWRPVRFEGGATRGGASFGYTCVRVVFVFRWSSTTEVRGSHVLPTTMLTGTAVQSPAGGGGGLAGGSQGDAQGVAFCHFQHCETSMSRKEGLYYNLRPKTAVPNAGGGGMTSAPRHARGPLSGRFLSAIERETALYFVGWDIRSTSLRPFRGLTAVRAS